MEAIFLATRWKGITVTGMALFFSSVSLKTASCEHIFLFY